LTSLVKKLDAAAATHADQKLGALVILLSDDEKAEVKLKEWAKAEKLENVVVAIENPQGPPKHQIAKDADVIVLLYAKKTVKTNFAFEKGKLTDKEAEKVAAAVKDILPEKKADK
jgi:hypothetical protein